MFYLLKYNRVVSMQPRGHDHGPSTTQHSGVLCLGRAKSSVFWADLPNTTRLVASSLDPHMSETYYCI
jgi:hypothetical protein